MNIQEIRTGDRVKAVSDRVLSSPVSGGGNPRINGEQLGVSSPTNSPLKFY